MCLDASEFVGDTCRDNWAGRKRRQGHKEATARRTVTKNKIMMARVMIEKEERSENTVLAMMKADISDTALVNNNFKDADA